MLTAPMVDEYLDLGWALCAIPRGGKRPLGTGWQVQATDRAMWDRYPDMGVGLIHAQSGTCALDLDDMDVARTMLRARGVDVDALMASGVQIVSGKENRGKLLYRAPAHVELRRVAIMGRSGRVAYELRGGVCQDVLPPTIHPDTGRAYAWSGDYADLPDLPEALLKVWVEAMDGGASKKAIGAPVRPRAAEEDGIIQRFNAAADIGHILTSAGYMPSGARWCAPDSTSGDPGVVLLPDTDPPRVYSHHGSDPLADGYSHDAFSCWCILEHGGDVTAAVRTAAEDLDDEVDPMVEQWLQARALSAGQKLAPVVDLHPAGVPLESPAPQAVAYCGTDVPEDPGPCPVAIVDALEGWLARQLHAPKPAAVRQAVLSLVCALTGRRYVTPHGHTASAYLAITDTSGAGLRELKPILYGLASAIGERASLRGTGFASASPLHRHLLRCPRIYWITDELGHMARMARRQQSGALESALAVVSELYDGRTMFVDPDSGGRTKERAISECDIHSPSMSMLAIIPHDLLGALAQRGEYGRGSLQQLLLAEAGDAVPGHRKEYQIDHPVMLETLAARIRASAGMPGTEDAPGIRPVQTVVEIDEPAAAVLRELRDAMLAMMDVDHLRRWRGMAHGYHQTAVRLSCALAAMEDPDRPVVGAEVARWVSGWVVRCLAEAVPRIETSEVDGESDVYQRVLAVLVDAGKGGLTSREIVQRSRPFRALSTEERARLLTQMRDDEAVCEVTTPRTVRYVGVSLFRRSG